MMLFSTRRRIRLVDDRHHQGAREAPHYEPNGRPTFHAARWRSRETTLAALFAISATTSCRYSGYSDALNFQTFFFYLFIHLS
jgi:hypothetical protein